jgi:hypothetical protein
MSETTHKLATWEDLLHTREGGPMHEILGGQLEVRPSLDRGTAMRR